MTSPRSSPTTRGVAYGLTAYLIWGVLPLYMASLKFVSPVLIVAHRVCWSVVLLALFLTLWRMWSAVRAVFASRRTTVLLLASCGLITVNWCTFTYLATSRQVMQSALGYFITPLVSAVLGMVFFRERLRGAQVLALILAAGGVTTLAVGTHTFPTFALLLALSWGFYGLVRKTAPVDALAGLFIETAIILPVAASVLVYAVSHPGTLTGSELTPGQAVYVIVGSGLFTTIPLILFNTSAKLLPLTTISFMQYVGPTVQFACAVGLGEPFTPVHKVAFALIWSAIVLYVLDTLRRRFTATTAGARTPSAPPVEDPI